MKETEIEGKILGIDPVAVCKQLLKLGAEYVGTLHFERSVFDTIPKTEARWVRLRTDGNKTTLSVKEIADDSVTGTSEWETTVDDYASTLSILEKIGVVARSQQENYRILFNFDGCEVSIDFWPKLEPYIEIEAPDSEEQVYTVAADLGFSRQDITGLNTDDLYKQLGIDIKQTARMAFDAAPTSLLAAKKIVEP